MNDVPRIGVIGTGWWATQFHLPGLVDGVDEVNADMDEQDLDVVGRTVETDELLAHDEEGSS